MNVFTIFKYMYISKPVILTYTPFAVHLEKIRNHLHQKSDNNAKIRSFAPIDIQLREMQRPQGYLHNCKHSIKFQLRLSLTSRGI